jgi:hypothetical protein
MLVAPACGPVPLPCLPACAQDSRGRSAQQHASRSTIGEVMHPQLLSLFLASAALGELSAAPLAALACPPVHWKRPSSLLHSEVIAFCL